MAVLQSNQKQTNSLPAYCTLTVVASAAGSGSVVRMADVMGGSSQGTTPIAAGETKVIGPFATPTWHEMVCAVSTLTYEIAPADFPSVTSGIERIVKLSQAEYDALSPPDATTLYVVVA
jgi:hypothetical protein